MTQQNKDSNLWVSDEGNNEADVISVEEEPVIEDAETPVEEEESISEPEEIKKGSKIRFKGTKSYSGLKISDGKDQTIYNVIEKSGDRLVIGKGTSVVSAVNAKDCEIVK